MQKLFIGLFFILINFNLHLYDVLTIELIPPFIGYFFLIKGICEVGQTSPTIAKLERFAKVLGVYMLLMFVLNLVGISAMVETINTVFSVVYSGFELYILYQLIQGLRELETIKRKDLGVTALSVIWKIYLTFEVVNYIFMIAFPVLILPGIVGQLLTAAIFLVEFYRAKKSYYDDGSCVRYV